MSGRCKAYGDLTLKFSNLMGDKALVDLFQEVLARRKELLKEINNPVGANSVCINRISQLGVSTLG